jgi:Transposase DDE domain
MLGTLVVHGSNSGGAGLRVVLGSRPAKLKKRRDNHRRSAAEPWLLATSLIDVTPASIVGIYATRMQIEETFRDAKNPRYGWALSNSSTRCPRRCEVLLLIASLAMLAAMLLGSAIEAAGDAGYFQANTCTSRRVLSVFLLGALALRESLPIRLADVLLEAPRRPAVYLQVRNPLYLKHNSSLL